MKKISQEAIQLSHYKIIEIDDGNSSVVVLIKKGNLCSRKWIDPAQNKVTSEMRYDIDYCNERE